MLWNIIRVNKLANSKGKFGSHLKYESHVSKWKRSFERVINFTWKITLQLKFKLVSKPFASSFKQKMHMFMCKCAYIFNVNREICSFHHFSAFYLFHQRVLLKIFKRSSTHRFFNKIFINLIISTIFTLP